MGIAIGPACGRTRWRHPSYGLRCLPLVTPTLRNHPNLSPIGEEKRTRDKFQFIVVPAPNEIVGRAIRLQQNGAAKFFCIETTSIALLLELSLGILPDTFFSAQEICQG